MNYAKCKRPIRRLYMLYDSIDMTFLKLKTHTKMKDWLMVARDKDRGLRGWVVREVGVTIKGQHKDPCDGIVLYLDSINIKSWLWYCPVVSKDVTLVEIDKGYRGSLLFLTNECASTITSKWSLIITTPPKSYYLFMEHLLYRQALCKVLTWIFLI